MFRYDGHSGGVTPGPIPNPEVKSARVSVCTVLRKRTGTQTRCQPLFLSYLVAERLSSILTIDDVHPFQDQRMIGGSQLSLTPLRRE